MTVGNRGITVACEELKQRIHNRLKADMFSGENDHVDVFDDGDVDIRILVISRKFDGDGHRIMERQTRIWNEIVSVMSKAESELISQLIAVSPEEIKACPP